MITIKMVICRVYIYIQISDHDSIPSNSIAIPYKSCIGILYTINPLSVSDHYAGIPQFQRHPFGDFLLARQNTAERFTAEARQKFHFFGAQWRAKSTVYWFTMATPHICHGQKVGLYTLIYAHINPYLHIHRIVINPCS